MADASEIARRAMQLATAHLETDPKRLADMAEGDLDVLREAARIVQKQPPPAAAGAGLSAEHLAFGLITAAYEMLRLKPPR